MIAYLFLVFVLCFLTQISAGNVQSAERKYAASPSQRDTPDSPVFDQRRNFVSNFVSNSNLLTVASNYFGNSAAGYGGFYGTYIPKLFAVGSDVFSDTFLNVDGERMRKVMLSKPQKLFQLLIEFQVINPLTCCRGKDDRVGQLYQNVVKYCCNLFEQLFDIEIKYELISGYVYGSPSEFDRAKTAAGDTTTYLTSFMASHTGRGRPCKPCKYSWVVDFAQQQLEYVLKSFENLDNGIPTDDNVASVIYKTLLLFGKGTQDAVEEMISKLEDNHIIKSWNPLNIDYPALRWAYWFLEDCESKGKPIGNKTAFIWFIINKTAIMMATGIVGFILKNIPSALEVKLRSLAISKLKLPAEHPSSLKDIIVTSIQERSTRDIGVLAIGLTSKHYQTIGRYIASATTGRLAADVTKKEQALTDSFGGMACINLDDKSVRIARFTKYTLNVRGYDTTSIFYKVLPAWKDILVPTSGKDVTTLRYPISPTMRLELLANLHHFQLLNASHFEGKFTINSKYLVCAWASDGFKDYYESIGMESLLQSDWLFALVDDENAQSCSAWFTKQAHIAKYLVQEEQTTADYETERRYVGKQMANLQAGEIFPYGYKKESTSGRKIVRERNLFLKLNVSNLTIIAGQAYFLGKSATQFSNNKNEDGKWIQTGGGPQPNVSSSSLSASTATATTSVGAVMTVDDIAQQEVQVVEDVVEGEDETYPVTSIIEDCCPLMDDLDNISLNDQISLLNASFTAELDELIDLKCTYAGALREGIVSSDDLSRMKQHIEMLAEFSEKLENDVFELKLARQLHHFNVFVTQHIGETTDIWKNI